MPDQLVPKHTPGPWKTDAAYPGCVYSDDATGSIVATAAGFKYAPRPDSEVKANAALIATAPKLLAQLRIAREWLIAVAQWPEDGEAIAEMDAAIAEAEGRTDG